MRDIESNLGEVPRRVMLAEPGVQCINIELG